MYKEVDKNVADLFIMFKDSINGAEDYVENYRAVLTPSVEAGMNDAFTKIADKFNSVIDYCDECRKLLKEIDDEPLGNAGQVNAVLGSTEELQSKLNIFRVVMNTYEDEIIKFNKEGK